MSEPGQRWEIFFERQAEKELRKLPRHILERLDRKLRRLAVNPWPPGCLRLEGYDLYQVWLGRDWRLTYAVEPGKIVVVEVAPRQRAYKGLGR